MALQSVFIFFVVYLTISEANKPIDAETLYNVFGYPKALPDQAAASATQFAAVKPSEGTLVDQDLWDLDDYVPAAADYDKFDWTLTKRVASSSDDNYLLSPLGLKLGLAILTEAATGSTRTELASVLGFDLNTTVVRRKFSNILESLQTKSDKYILNLGSRIYIGNSTQPRQRFAAIAHENYKTDITNVDFNKPAQATAEINGWVSNITEGRISSLFKEDDINSMVVLILNTIFFKGNWQHQFNPNETHQGPFFSSPKSRKEVTFMTTRSNFYYVDSTKFDAKILRMPYLGGKFAMYIIVPNSILGLPRVLNNLSDLRNELYYLKKSTVDVTLPKFKFEYTSKLDQILKELGIRQAFEDTASFPGIARGHLLQDRLKITKILQRSGIEVNELGSIAYSSTAFILDNRFGLDKENIEEVIANKPFVFFIQDEATRQLLFTGRVSDPSEVDGTFT